MTRPAVRAIFSTFSMTDDVTRTTRKEALTAQAVPLHSNKRNKQTTRDRWQMIQSVNVNKQCLHNAMHTGSSTVGCRGKVGSGKVGNARVHEKCACHTQAICCTEYDGCDAHGDGALSKVMPCIWGGASSSATGQVDNDAEACATEKKLLVLPKDV